MNVYSLIKDNTSDWYLCNPAFGVVPFKQVPFVGVEIVTEQTYSATHYAQLNETLRDNVSYNWLLEIMLSFSTLGVTNAYFKGGYSKKDEGIRNKYGLPTDGMFQWRKELIVEILKINVENLLLKTNSASLAVVDNWDNVYVDDISFIPKNLLKPINNESYKDFQ